MLIVNNEQAYNNNQLFRYIPKKFRRALHFIEMDGLEEIRLRQGLPVMLYYTEGQFFLSPKGHLQTTAENALTAVKQDIQEGLELISESSIYAVEHELRKGYITISGGHRVGICGTAVETEQGIGTIKDISGLNYRISRECVGISDKLMDGIMRGGEVLNTLIISPPQCGKTTLLRDIVRNISNRGRKVSLVDERSELAAMSNGYQGYDLGMSCDVLEGALKSEGMLLMLRSMSPEVVVTDELGDVRDIAAVAKIIHSGVSVISTVHCRNREELLKRPDMQKLASYFDCFITLSRRNGVGTVEEVYCAL